MVKTFFKSNTKLDNINNVINSKIKGTTTIAASNNGNNIYSKMIGKKYTSSMVDDEENINKDFDFILNNIDNKFNNNFILDNIDLTYNLSHGYDLAFFKFNHHGETSMVDKKKANVTNKISQYKSINLQIKPDSFIFNLIDFILINFVNLKKYSDPIASTIFNLHITISFYNTNFHNHNSKGKIELKTTNVIEKFKLTNLNDLNKLNALLTKFQLKDENLNMHNTASNITANDNTDNDTQQISIFSYKLMIDQINTNDDSNLKTFFSLNQFNLDNSFEIDKFHNNSNNNIENKLIKPIINDTIASLNNSNNSNFYFVGNTLPNNFNLLNFINQNCLSEIIDNYNNNTEIDEKLQSLTKNHFEKKNNFLIGNNRKFNQVNDKFNLIFNNMNSQLNWATENSISNNEETKNALVGESIPPHSNVSDSSIEKIIHLENENFQLRDTLHQLIFGNANSDTDTSANITDTINSTNSDFDAIDIPTKSILWDKLAKVLETKLALNKLNLEQSILLKKIELLDNFNKINKTNETNQLDIINDQQLEINKILTINNKLSDGINDMNKEITDNFHVLSNLNSQLARKENRKKRISRRKSSIISITTSVNSSSTDNSLFDLYEDDDINNSNIHSRKNSNTTNSLNSSVPRSFSVNSNVSVSSPSKGFQLKIIKADS